MSTRRFVAAAAFVAVVLAPGIARTARAADTKDACFDAYEQAQRLRKAGDLRAARDKLSVCAAASCPDFVRKDCGQWGREVDAQIATIVVQAKDANGHPVDAADVYVDGAKVSDRLDGKPLPLNPGEHTVRVDLAGKSREQRITANEGAHDVLVVADFTETKAAPTPEPPPPPPPESGAGGLPVWTYVLGGVAVAGAGAFVAFGLSGKSEESCKPTCTRSQVDTLRREYLFADVSLLVALAAGGGAVYFALAKPTSGADAQPAASTASVAVSVRPVLGGGMLGADVRF